METFKVFCDCYRKICRFKWKPILKISSIVFKGTYTQTPIFPYILSKEAAVHFIIFSIIDLVQRTSELFIYGNDQDSI